MNSLIIDGCVQQNPKLDETENAPLSFNISVVTGTIDERRIFTYIRVILNNTDKDVLNVIEPGRMIRIYGKLNSEQYITKSNKIVYNKIIDAENVVPIRFNKDIGDYVEIGGTNVE